MSLCSWFVFHIRYPALQSQQVRLKAAKSVLFPLAVQNGHDAEISAIIQLSDFSGFADKAAAKGKKIKIAGQKPLPVRVLRIQSLVVEAEAKEPFLPAKQQESLPLTDQQKHREQQQEGESHPPCCEKDRTRSRRMEDPDEHSEDRRHSCNQQPGR